MSRVTGNTQMIIQKQRYMHWVHFTQNWTFGRPAEEFEGPAENIWIQGRWGSSGSSDINNAFKEVVRSCPLEMRWTGGLDSEDVPQYEYRDLSKVKNLERDNNIKVPFGLLIYADGRKVFLDFVEGEGIRPRH